MLAGLLSSDEYRAKTEAQKFANSDALITAAAEALAGRCSQSSMSALG